MPVFRTQPSGNLTDAVRRYVSSSQEGITTLDELKAASEVADIAHKNSLVQKVRAEIQRSQDKTAAEAEELRRRRDPELQTEYAGLSSGMDMPNATRLAGAIQGRLEQPSPADMSDAGAVGRDAQPYPMEKPNLQAGQERLFRSVLASVRGLDFATGHTNAEQLAKAGGEHQQNLVAQGVQEHLARGDAQGASALNQSARPGTAIKLFDNIGDSGATFAPATGSVQANPAADPTNRLLPATLAVRNADAAHKRAQAETERKPSGEGQKAPTGYRWGPPDTEGNPTLVPIEGGPATIKATSSDAERISAGYASRMLASAKIMGELEASGVGKPEAGETAAAALPGGLGKIASNAAMSPDRQKFRQAQEDWVRAKLRKESGAVIADEEMDREIRTYFPQIGDKPGTVKQKAHSRATAEQAMVQAAGRSHVAQGQQPGAAGNVEAEKMIGNVRFVKVGGKWYTP